MSGQDSLKALLSGICEDLESLNYFLPRDVVERRVAHAARRERLERAKPAVTDADLLAIVHDRLDQNTHALQAVQRWLRAAFGDDPGKRSRAPRFLVLSGERGRGKTVAAAWAIANEVSMYLTAGELRRMRLSHNALDVEDLRRAHGARLLVLDDLGVEKLDEGSEEMFFELINVRQGGGRYTLVTTNLTEHQMRARYGDRALDRINHQGGFVPITGDNLRERSFARTGK